MGMLINLINFIEDAINYIVTNKELIIGGSIISLILGIIAGLIMVPVFS